MADPKDTTKKVKKPYYYKGLVTITAANGIGQLSFNISSGYHYLMTGFSFKSYIASANAIPTFDLQIARNEEAFFSDYVPNEMFAGVMTETSTAPDTRYVMGQTNWHNFDVPYLFEEKSTMVITLKDTSGIANNNIIFCAKGFRLYFGK